LFIRVPSKEIHVCQAIVSVLAEAQIDYVLGIPGGYTANLFPWFFGHPTIRVIQVREESIGAIMADAYGRLTGRPVVVMGQGEWISGNAGQGLMEALLGSSPVLVLTEMTEGGALSHHGNYQSGSGDYGNWDAVTALRGVTKRVMVSHYPAQAVQHTQLAIKHALTGQPGPVAVIYRAESLDGTVGPESVPRIYPTSAYLPARSSSVANDALRAAADVLRSATDPVILAGNGVRVGQACESLAALARAVDCPVATTSAGKGVFPEIDDLAVGVIGSFGAPTANAVVAGADVVLAVGTKLAPIDTANENASLLDPERQTLIQIDVEPLNVSWTYPVDCPLVGEAGYVMDRLREEYLSGHRAPRENGSIRVASARQEFPVELVAPTSDETPLLPQRIISLIEDALPKDGIVTSDAGENRIFMLHWYRTKSLNSYLMPSGGGMGYAVPAAMGAKLAYPKRDVVAVVGDGGFAMSIHALMTAVQEKIPISVVVFNNSSLGWVLHSTGERAIASAFAEFDHGAIARSIGCEGVRVNSISELSAALAKVSNRVVPLVIDVPTSMETSFRDVVSPLADERWKRSETRSEQMEHVQDSRETDTKARQRSAPY
jgi:acetolactate synthase-1/2/3 large subunit